MEKAARSAPDWRAPPSHLGFEEQVRLLNSILAGSTEYSIIACDMQGVILAWNEGARRIYGYEPEDVIGVERLRLLHVKDDIESGLADQIAEAARGLGKWSGEVRRVRKDGRQFVAHVTITLRGTAEGEPSGFTVISRDITAEKRTEAKLREFDENGRGLIESNVAKNPSLIDRLDAIVWETNDRLETVFVSERVEALLGYSRVDALKRAFRSRITHPADRERVRRAFKQAWALRQDFEIEYRTISSLGEELWLHDAVQVEIAADGGISGMLGITCDITQQKREAHAYAEGEARFRMLAENIPDVFWITTPNFEKPLYVSPAYEKIWGRSVESYYAKHDWLEGVHPDDAPRLRQHMDQASESYDIDYRVVRPDGTVRWVRDRAFPVLDAQKRVVQVAGVAADITDRKVASEAIRMAEAKLRQIFDSSPAVTFAARIEGAGFRPIWVSANVLRVFGYSATEVMEPDWWFQHVHADDVEGATQAVVRTPIGESGTREYRLRRPDGEYRWVRDAFRISQLDDGVEIVGACTDWSEPKRIAQQFEHSQRMELVGRLAGGVAHDFNNLLTAISSYTQLLTSSCTIEDPRRADLHEIANAADRAAGLTRQLLAFSRRQIMQPRSIGMNDVLLNMERLLRRIIGEDLKFTIQCDETLRSVYADPGQMEQVILNLAVNARDAMSNGGRLLISTANERVTAGNASALRVPPGDYVRIAVSDTGTGIEPAVLGQIFEPFFTTKPAGKGTGLGLSTVLGIVQQSGGHVTVDSAPDRGTTFSVYLPATDAVKEPGSQAVTAASDFIQRSATVLLVEDEAVVRTLILRILSRAGYRVIEASDGESALGKAAEPIDLLITDVVLPGMSGPQLAAQLQQAQPGLHVLFTSGYTDDDVFERGVTAGVAHFLGKPFTPVQLLAAVEARFAADGV